MTDKLKYINDEEMEKIKDFYIDIAKIAARLDPNANSVSPIGRQAVIANILKIYEMKIT